MLQAKPDSLTVRFLRAGLLTIACLFWFAGCSKQAAPAEGSFKDDPAAHALYSQMVEAMRKATTLSWIGDYHWEVPRYNNYAAHTNNATYRIWLKKPNYARVEAMPGGSNDPSGILVGDGDYFWIYWPQEKPRYSWERSGKYAKEYEKNRRTFYMKERTLIGRHSISHEVAELGAGIAMTIVDPSTFHGYTDSLQPYLDGVRSMGTEKIGGELCDEVEVSFMKHQRSWYLWLSRRDHLPRKLRETIRVFAELNKEETWSNLTINAEIPNNLFAWSPPPGWKEYRMPTVEEGLLQPGTTAPDFDLKALGGGTIKLSNFHGRIVWLNVWRCG